MVPVRRSRRKSKFNEIKPIKVVCIDELAVGFTKGKVYMVIDKLGDKFFIKDDTDKTTYVYNEYFKKVK